MARRSDHSREELQTLILDTAWTLVGQGGTETLSARKLASKIGYAAGTIYNHFDSMDDLILRVNGRTLDELFAVLNSPACNDPAHSPVQNMKKMAALYMEFAKTRAPYWLMLFNTALPPERTEITWYQEKIDLLFAPLETQLTSFFTAGQEKRKKMAARILWSSIHGLCFLEETDKLPLVSGKIGALDMANYLIESFVSGVVIVNKLKSGG
ncbi:MAG: TetR/AcrR family transcriptional regulator [Rhodospirillales bacterium]|nr:TetR/AcrR family transcriptional regulator [Rhodospirillales bacterium]